MSAPQKPVLSPDGTHVYTRNVESGDEWLCPVDHLEVALLRGFFELSEPVDNSLDGLVDEPAKPAKKAASKTSGD